MTSTPLSARRIGVISDTHGLLRPEAVTALEGVRHILHAGDVGDPAILDALARIVRSRRSAATSTAGTGPPIFPRRSPSPSVA